MQAWAHVTFTGRPTVRVRIEDGTTLGSSPQADIRVTDESISEEHFSFKPQEEGCWVELTDAATTPFTVEGKPLRRGLVPWGQELYFGKLRILFEAEATRDKSGKLGAPMWIAVALTIPTAAALFYLASVQQGGGFGRAAAQVPKLFGPPPECSEAEDGALHRAQLAEAAAHSKHQRGRFHQADAVDAVQLIREASQCYFLGGREMDAQRTADLAERWQERLEFEYDRARLALDLARRKGQQRAIVERSRELSTLLRHAGEDAAAYKLWLDGVTRSQHAAHAEKAQQRKKQ